MCPDHKEQTHTPPALTAVALVPQAPRCLSAGAGASRAHLDVQAEAGALPLHDAGDVVDGELLRELVIHAHLARVCRVVDRDLDAPHLRRGTNTPPCSVSSPANKISIRLK